MSSKDEYIALLIPELKVGYGIAELNILGKNENKLFWKVAKENERLGGIEIFIKNRTYSIWNKSIIGVHILC